MVTESEATEIVKAAKAWECRYRSSPSFPQESAICFFRDRRLVTITPAAWGTLSPEAMRFAVLHGLATDEIGGDGQKERLCGVILLGVLTGWIVI